MAEMQPGDALIGLPSSGPHTNGYSLIRRAVEGHDLDQQLADGQTLADALLAPHRCYVSEVETIQRAGIAIKGMAHITGGGFIENVPQILPPALRARLVTKSWTIPPVFRQIITWSGIDRHEAYRVFNLGIGFVLVTTAADAETILNLLPEAVVIGRLVARDDQARWSWSSTMPTRLAVLISGNGSNLQAIIDAIRMKVLPAQVVVVVSNHKTAYGLERATKAGIETLYHPLKPYSDTGRSRTDYDADLAELVLGFDPDYVVLAGWMHILSAAFLQHFPYRVVNLHPALPGQFPGSHAIADAFAAYQQGTIKHTGCMVHLVPDEAVDAGPIIGSVDVPIYPTDTEETLANRMHQAEHSLLIQSLLRLIRGRRGDRGSDEGDEETDFDDDEDRDDELDDE